MSLRKELFYILTILCFYLPACSEKKEKVQMERISLNDLPTDTLRMETLIKLPDQWAPEFHMANDTLIVLLYQQDASLLRFFGTGEKEIRKYTFRKPKEQLPIEVDASLHTSFQFFHTGTNIFYEYEIENGKLRLAEFTRLRIAKATPRQSLKVDNNLFAGIGHYPKGLWGLCNRKKKELYFFGDYPIKQEYASEVLLPLFEGHIAQKDNQLIYAASEFGFISSYTYAKGKIKKNWERQLADFLVEEKISRVIVDSLHTSGFRDVYISGKHIYGLYSGYSKHSGWGMHNSVILFTHNGDPVARYYFPDLMDYIAVDSEEKYLYATYSPYMNESFLVRFELPSP